MKERIETVETVKALEICLKHIRAAGCVPNSKFYAALRAARALDAACSEPEKTVEGSEFLVVCQNGYKERVFVPKGGDIFKIAKARNLEIYSFSRI